MLAAEEVPSFSPAYCPTSFPKRIEYQEDGWLLTTHLRRMERGYPSVVGLYAAIVDTFPAAIRATGRGFVMRLGRLSGTAAPALGGGLFQTGLGVATVTAVLCCGAVAAGLLLLRGERTPPINSI